MLLVGEHLDDDPELDLYRGLYRLLGLPEPTGKRTKPPCCDEEGRSPVDPDLLDRFWSGARELNSRSRRSLQRS